MGAFETIASLTAGLTVATTLGGGAAFRLVDCQGVLRGLWQRRLTNAIGATATFRMVAKQCLLSGSGNSHLNGRYDGVAAVRQKINAVSEWLDQLLESIERTAS